MTTENGPLAAQPLNYYAPPGDLWRPVVRMVAWTGVVLGAGKLIAIAGIYLLLRDRVMIGPADGLFVYIQGIIGLLLLIAALGCVQRNVKFLPLFIWSAGAMATIAFLYLSYQFVNFFLRFGSDALWYLLMHTIGWGAASILLPLLLMLIMRRPEARATFEMAHH